MQVFKVVWFARFLEGVDRGEGRRHWREVHGPLGLKVPQIKVYVQSHAVAALGPAEENDVPLAFDGYSSCSFADEESYAEVLQETPAWADIAADRLESLRVGLVPGDVRRSR